MMKRSILAMFGLAIVLSLASPSRANAEVVFGVGVGPVYARPAYGYVYVHPRPYVFQRRYVAPAYVYPSYGYYDRFDRDRRWDRRDRDYDYRDRYDHRRDWR